MVTEQVSDINLDEFFTRQDRNWLQADYKISQSPIQRMDDLCKRSGHAMDEPALILEAQHGDLDSFNHLILVHQDYLFNTALRILGDDELAADASQEAFILAFRGINQYHGGSFKIWLIRIVTNVCYDELRRQKRRPTVSLEPFNTDGEEMDSPGWLVDPSRSAEEELDAAELEQAIQHCLDRLPLNFRTVIVLADVQGLNYKEMASAVRVPLGTIKSRLARARLRLREHLRQGFCELLPDRFHSEKERPL
jgi:RNA polymerase sigma-70 factor, ECF subfamily